METRSSPERGAWCSKNETANSTEANERGCTHDSFSLSFRSTRDSNLIHPLPSNSIVSSFARSFVRSSARFLNLFKRDWKLCSFVGSFSWCTPAVGNSAKQILRTRNWLDSIFKGEGKEGEGRRQQLSSSEKEKVVRFERHLCLSIKFTRSLGPTLRSLSPNLTSTPSPLVILALDQFPLFLSVLFLLSSAPLPFNSANFHATPFFLHFHELLGYALVQAQECPRSRFERSRLRRCKKLYYVYLEDRQENSRLRSLKRGKRG